MGHQNINEKLHQVKNIVDNFCNFYDIKPVCSFNLWAVYFNMCLRPKYKSKAAFNNFSLDIYSGQKI